MSFLLDLWFMLPAPLKWVVIAAFAYFAATVLLGSLLPIILIAVALGGLLYVGLAAKSGAVALSGTLGAIVRALTNSAPVSGSPTIAQPGAASAQPQTPPPPSITPREAYEIGSRTINALHGNDGAKRQLEALVNVAEVAAKRGEKGLGLTAPLHLILLHGPSGTGKSKVAEALPALLYGVGALPEYKAVFLAGRDVRDAGISGASQFAEKKTVESRGGVLIVEDADWLAGIRGNPGADFAVEVARALINVAEVFPRDITIVATGRGQTRQSLLENRDLRSALLNKIDVSEIEFHDLSLDDLLATYRDLEAKAGISTAVDAMPQVRRLIEQRRDADKDDFSNAYAVERILDAALKRANQRPNSGNGRIVLTRDDFLIPVT